MVRLRERRGCGVMFCKASEKNSKSQKTFLLEIFLSRSISGAVDLAASGL